MELNSHTFAVESDHTDWQDTPAYREHTTKERLVRGLKPLPMVAAHSVRALEMGRYQNF